MRIIAGEYRGRPLKAPKGSTTRPTIDRVRESLMSTVMSARGTWDGTIVLDAFAGSGSLGIEALSRGAAFSCFCDCDKTALDVLAQNTSFLRPGTFSVARVDVLRRLPPRAASPFDLVFLDPPYATDVQKTASLLVRLRDAGMLAEGALISFEHDKSCDPVHERSFESLESELLVHKTYGATIVDIFRYARIVSETADDAAEDTQTKGKRGAE